MNMVDKTDNCWLNYLVIGTKLEPLFLCSQSHILSNNLISIIVYFEIPMGKREEEGKKKVS